MTEELLPPRFVDVLEARRRIAPYLRPTPLYQYPQLAELVGTETWVKHENHLPVGAFKVRGGINLVSHLDDDVRRRGLVSASTGNHGQSIAFAGRLFGAPVTICVPEGANPVKVASMQALGADVVFFGRDFDATVPHAREIAQERGARFVHSGDEPLLIAGVGTYTLEILEDQPQVDVIIVPIGGGSGAAGACVVAKAVAPHVQVIGVQSEAAPAAHLSWQARAMRESTMQTFAEGLATRSAFALPQRILWEHLDDFVLVSEAEIRRATRLMIERTRNLVEPAGAASLAAAMQLRDRLAGRRVAMVCSGGNISPQQLRDVLADEG